TSRRRADVRDVFEVNVRRLTLASAALGFVLGCPRHRDGTTAPAVVHLVVDGADPSVSGASYEIAVDDSAGALVAGPIAMSGATVDVVVPARGSLALRESRSTGESYLKVWSSPEAGTTIHAVDSLAPIAVPSP